MALLTLLDNERVVSDEKKVTEVDPSKWQKLYFTPTKSDTNVVASRKWLNKFAGRKVLDHVVNCSSCSAAYKGLNVYDGFEDLIQAWCAALSVILLCFVWGVILFGDFGEEYSLFIHAANLIETGCLPHNLSGRRRETEEDKKKPARSKRKKKEKDRKVSNRKMIVEEDVKKSAKTTEEERKKERSEQFLEKRQGRKMVKGVRSVGEGGMKGWGGGGMKWLLREELWGRGN
ncbi:hypothetical protein Tco_0474407 [Tanacetum coccineum]